MVRASRIHIGMMDQNTQQIATIRRAIKSMSDCLSQRRLKIVTANAKAIKMFELLRAWNHEVREQRERFQEAYDKRKEQQTAHAASLQQPQPRVSGLSAGLLAKTRPLVTKPTQTP